MVVARIGMVNGCGKCSACRHQTTLLSGTLFEATKLPLRTWFLALYLLTQSKTNVAALELMRHLGVCYRTAWRIKHKLMQAMTEREAGRQLGGLVQIDDAYLGGERNGGKPGRGSENKCPFVIAVELSAESHPLHAVITPVHGFTNQALTDWTRLHLRPETEVHSDGLGAFRAVIEAGHAHTVIESEGGRAATEAGGMRWVNTVPWGLPLVVLSNVKRSLDGTYHAFRFAAYAHRYLAEAAWRFNRRFNLKILVPRLLVAAARCKAWPERRLRAMPATPAG
ncbi:ISXo5 transposase [mine drainage metagenome]|uniref:ISXo5 transposase n=1 Tax=mine drainage metagenome TaxID=410659 RepID=T1C1E9_9ZZZZ